jgi:transcriptional regulator with XRE-family HTH domain
VVSDFKTQLGQALKQQRQRRKLSQSKLAELADVSDRYIADIEAGKANLTMKVLDRLATALDWDPLAELTVDAEPPSPAAARDVLAKLSELGQSLEHTIDRLKALHAKYGIDGDEAPLESDPVDASSAGANRRAVRKSSTQKRKSTPKVH